MAAAVADRYAEQDMPGHALAIEAQEVLSEARLTLHLWELNPDPDHWRKAVAELRALQATLRRTHGATNPLTLAAGVDFCYALVSQGHRDEGRSEVDRTLLQLGQRLGADHPLHCRTVFLDGLLHAQLQQYDLARSRFEEALRGQRAALGITHAHTLRTQYELAVACKLLGDGRWLPLMREVKGLAPHAVGRTNDLYAQSCIALGLLRLPTPLVRAVTRRGRPKP